MKVSIKSIIFVVFQLIVVCSLIVIIVGCSRDAKSKANPYYLRGLTLRQNDSFEQAADSFARCLRVDPDSAEAHLQLGTLYEDHLEDKIRAFYHYHMYLLLQPEGQNAGIVRESIHRVRGYIITDDIMQYPEIIKSVSRAGDLETEVERLVKARQLLMDQIRGQAAIIHELKAELKKVKP